MTFFYVKERIFADNHVSISNAIVDIKIDITNRRGSFWMSLTSIMTVVFAIYLYVGLFIAYRFITKELTEIFDEELDEKEDMDLIRSRDQLYDAFHNLEKVAGRKGVTIIIYLMGMLFWLPIWVYSKLSS
ncbi:hypothetical protein D3C73_615130 [compost metagenome]